MPKTFSVDAEVDGLYGDVFAIGVIVAEAGVEIDRFIGRADVSITNEWVKENVLPVVKDIPAEYNSAKELRDAFWAFWQKHSGNGVVVVAHCGNPVETGLFRACVMDNLPERQWAGPMYLYDVAVNLFDAGENPTSVSAFIEKHNLTVPFEGDDHHPLYDAMAALVVYNHFHKG